MAYTIISLICIAVMIVLVVWLIVKFCLCNRAGKIEFIKNFKRGKCTIIYFVAIPLYLIAYLFAGKSVSVAIFEAISKSVYLVVLKYDVSVALISENIYFAIALYTCLTLVIINAMMISISILHQSLWKSYRLFRFLHTKQNRCIVIGNNEKTISVYDSCGCPVLLIDTLSKEEQEKLYIKGVSYQSLRTGRLYSWLIKLLNKEVKKLSHSGAKIDIIVNRDDDRDNLAWCNTFLKFINEREETVADNVEIYVFGDREFEDIYSKYEEKSKGCLHYVNEYQQIAVDFIDRYPLTEYMDERHIDYRTSLLKPETEINVAMIGFGRTNQQIFLSMVANNQFLTTDENGNIVPKEVHYHLFDRLHTGSHKNLNHNYFRYCFDFFDKEDRQKIQANEDEYLPLPKLPAEEEYHYLDINDLGFYGNLEATLNFDERAVNYVIVSLGMDYESVDFANKIVARLKELGVHNTHVFVRIREDKILKNSDVFLDRGICQPFGSEKHVVYDYSNIIREKFAEMAIMRNFIYDIEHDMKHYHVSEEEKKTSRLKWHVKLSTSERESNVYACLGLRAKLQLMGLDYCKNDGSGKEGVSEEEYYAIYAASDMPDFVKDASGHAVSVKYPIIFKESRRKNLAVQEHSRWNAFMITKGFVPASKERILKETDGNGKRTNGKNYEMRHHGNLTTFEGLVEFRSMVAKRDNIAEEACDVIKYDYQLLDGAWWLLTKNGYKIIKRR